MSINKKSYKLIFNCYILDFKGILNCILTLFLFYYLDRRHFDNPVYAYQGVPLNGASTSLNNTGTKHIHNDLGMKNNLAKSKLGDEDFDTYTEKGNA